MFAPVFLDLLETHNARQKIRFEYGRGIYYAILHCVQRKECWPVLNNCDPRMAVGNMTAEKQLLHQIQKGETELLA